MLKRDSRPLARKCPPSRGHRHAQRRPARLRDPPRVAQPVTEPARVHPGEMKLVVRLRHDPERFNRPSSSMSVIPIPLRRPRRLCDRAPSRICPAYSSAAQAIRARRLGWDLSVSLIVSFAVIRPRRASLFQCASLVRATAVSARAAALTAGVTQT